MFAAGNARDFCFSFGWTHGLGGYLGKGGGERRARVVILGFGMRRRVWVNGVVLMKLRIVLGNGHGALVVVFVVDLISGGRYISRDVIGSG